jgi:L-alanine-DL-glutamate epimerase-like enolase superfamily enzyme
MSRLQRTCPWPVALDESLAGSGAEAYLRHPSVRQVVLKPMVLGGPLAALSVARRARREGIRAVVTTTLDSAVGRAAALHLAAAIDTDTAHGLATGEWLRDDIASGPSPRSPRPVPKQSRDSAAPGSFVIKARQQAHRRTMERLSQHQGRIKRQTGWYVI